MPSNKPKSFNKFALGTWLAIAYGTRQNMKPGLSLDYF